MIIDFTRIDPDDSNFSVLVKNAIVAQEDECFYALHDNPNAEGFIPEDPKKRFGKAYGWRLKLDDGIDLRNIIFRGWYKPEEKIVEKAEKKPVYKIGNMVKFNYLKCEVIGFHEDIVWLKYKNEKNTSSSYWTAGIGQISPWIDEPVKPKYQVGDLVQVTNGEFVKIISISNDGTSYDSITLDGKNHYNTLRDENIVRKIGVAVKE
jgi:hypothetical protein